MKITKDETVTELEINNPDEAIKVLLIQNVFNLYGGNVDMGIVLDMIGKIGRSYSQFYDHMNKTKEMENENEKKLESKSEEIKTQMIEGYIQQEEENQLGINPEEIKKAILNKDDTNNDDYYVTGIKIKNGIKHYRLHYECPACNYKANHVVPLIAKSVHCHSCNKEMKVKFANPESTGDNLIPDTKGNWLRAGVYKDFKLWTE